MTAGIDPVSCSRIMRTAGSFTQEIWSTTASVTGQSFKHVSEVGRRIREAGHFTRATRSPNSPRADELDCARLILALMTNVSAQKAPAALERLLSARRDERKWIEENTTRSLDTGSQEAAILHELDNMPGLRLLANPDHSVADALAAMIRLARQDLAQFRRELTRESFLEVRHDDLTAELSYSREPSLFSEESPINFSIFYVQRNSMKLVFNSYSRISFEAPAALAELFNRRARG